MIIAIVNQKGGVGKTAMTVGLAYALAAPQTDVANVLVVDADPQANATKILGIELGEDDFTLLDILTTTPRNRQAAVATALVQAGPGWHGIHALPSERALASCEMDNSPGREARLKDSLEAIASEYAYVLIDCPPSLGLLTLNALTAADLALVVTELHEPSLDGVDEMLTTISMVRDHYNPSLSLAGVVVNKWRKGTIDQEEHLVKAKESLGSHLLEPMVPDRTAIHKAATSHLPVQLALSSDTEAAQACSTAYSEIAHILEGRNS